MNMTKIGGPHHDSGKAFLPLYAGNCSDQALRLSQIAVLNEMCVMDVSHLFQAIH